ncbi:alpha/beta hydrolase-fold protein [Actinoplanes sp. NPDC049668]|uniref:alpha/beta hydrolase-fold protein n=1 Tax=unclassified Actinoplanes TaxID=2626549 RepID=UPI0033AEC776
MRVVAHGDPGLAINRLRRQSGVDDATVDRFLARYSAPVVEGGFCTFLYRGEADAVRLAQRIIGLPDRLPMHRLPGTDLWYVIVEMPTDSRVEYQLEVVRDGRTECHNDPLNPKLAHSPVGSSSVCFGPGYVAPDWTVPDPEAPPGQLDDLVVHSDTLTRDYPVTLYRPAGCCPTGNYRLLVVHDGGDFLRYAAARTVLDNLIHRRQMAETVVAFLHPKDRLNEYADSAEHAEFVTRELLPLLENDFPLAGAPSTRCLLGSSFGAVASLSMARRYPGTYGSLALLSGSFVSSRPDGAPHGGGPTFDPVVAFVDDYRRRPTRVADRVFVSCGAFEPLIVRQPPMLETFRSVGMRVRYVESNDGHTWVNWRDRLCDALSWALPPD